MVHSNRVAVGWVVHHLVKRPPHVTLSTFGTLVAIEIEVARRGRSASRGR